MRQPGRVVCGRERSARTETNRSTFPGIKWVWGSDALLAGRSLEDMVSLATGSFALPSRKVRPSGTTANAFLVIATASFHTSALPFVQFVRSRALQDGV